MSTNSTRACDHLPTLEERIPIAGAAPPSPPQRDLVGDLRRAQAHARRATWPSARRAQDATIARLVTTYEETPPDA